MQSPDVLAPIREFLKLESASGILLVGAAILALVFALPLGSRWNARPVRGTDIAWAGAIAVALAVFLAVGEPGGGTAHATAFEWVAAFGFCTLNPPPCNASR